MDLRIPALNGESDRNKAMKLQILSLWIGRSHTARGDLISFLKQQHASQCFLTLVHEQTDLLTSPSEPG